MPIGINVPFEKCSCSVGILLLDSYDWDKVEAFKFWSYLSSVTQSVLMATTSSVLDASSLLRNLLETGHWFVQLSNVISSNELFIICAFWNWKYLSLNLTTCTQIFIYEQKGLVSTEVFVIFLGWPRYQYSLDTNVPVQSPSLIISVMFKWISIRLSNVE